MEGNWRSSGIDSKFFYLSAALGGQLGRCVSVVTNNIFKKKRYQSEIKISIDK